MARATEIKKGKDIKKRITRETFLIESLKTVVEGIAKTFGPRCEVLLHDIHNLANLDHSIVKIVNGHVTGRTAGGPITDQGLKILRSGTKGKMSINYPSVTKNGRTLKSSTMFFKNDRGKPIAALCINFDVSDILNFNTAIQDIFSISQETGGGEPVETFEGDVASTLNDIADKIIRKTGKAVPSMIREDKIEIVRQLDEQGVFLIKGAIKLIATKLQVSKYTIYNYREQIRS